MIGKARVSQTLYRLLRTPQRNSDVTHKRFKYNSNKTHLNIFKRSLFFSQMAYVGKLSSSFQEILSFFAYLLCISFALLRPTVTHFRFS